MKKLFRTLLAVMVAIVMCFAVVALSGAGCKDEVKDIIGDTTGEGNTDDKKGDGNNTDPASPSDPGNTPGAGDETNPDNTPGNTPGSGEEDPGDTPVTPVTPVAPPLVLPELQLGKYSNLLSTEYEAIGIQAFYVPDYNSSGNDAMFAIDAKVNLNGNADIALSGPGTTSDTGYTYMFMRDWAVYSTGESETEITDFTSAELAGVVDVNEAIEVMLASSGVEFPEELVSMLNPMESVTSSLTNINYLLLSIADAAGTIEERDVNEDGVEKALMIDVVGTLNTMATEVAEVVKEWGDTTTVGDILGNETVEKYLKIFTELVTPEDGVALVKNVVEIALCDPELTAEDAAMLQGVVAFLEAYPPEEGSSTYDYLVSLLSAFELDKMTVSDIIAMAEADITLQGLKEELAMLTEIFGEKAISLPQLSITNLYVGYGYTGNYNLVMQIIGANIDSDTSIAMEAGLSFMPEAYTNLAALPEELPEIPEFNPEDFFPTYNKVRNLDGCIFVDNKKNTLTFYEGEFVIADSESNIISSGYYDQEGDSIVFAATLEDLETRNDVLYGYQKEGGDLIVFESAELGEFYYGGNFNPGTGEPDDPNYPVAGIEGAIFANNGFIIRFGTDGSIDITNASDDTSIATYYFRQISETEINIYYTVEEYKNDAESAKWGLDMGHLSTVNFGILEYVGGENGGEDPPKAYINVPYTLWTNKETGVQIRFEEVTFNLYISNDNQANGWYRQEAEIIYIYETEADWKNDVNGQQVTLGEGIALIWGESGLVFDSYEYIGSGNEPGVDPVDPSQNVMQVAGRIFKHTQTDEYIVFEHSGVFTLIDASENQENPTTVNGKYYQEGNMVICIADGSDEIRFSIKEELLIKDGDEDTVFGFFNYYDEPSEAA